MSAKTLKLAYENGVKTGLFLNSVFQGGNSSSFVSKVVDNKNVYINVRITQTRDGETITTISKINAKAEKWFYDWLIGKLHRNSDHGFYDFSIVFSDQRDTQIYEDSLRQRLAAVKGNILYAKTDQANYNLLNNREWVHPGLDSGTSTNNYYTHIGDYKAYKTIYTCTVADCIENKAVETLYLTRGKSPYGEAMETEYVTNYADDFVVKVELQNSADYSNIGCYYLPFVDFHILVLQYGQGDNKYYCFVLVDNTTKAYREIDHNDCPVGGPQLMRCFSGQGGGMGYMGSGGHFTFFLNEEHWESYDITNYTHPSNYQEQEAWYDIVEKMLYFVDFDTSELVRVDMVHDQINRYSLPFAPTQAFCCTYYVLLTSDDYDDYRAYDYSQIIAGNMNSPAQKNLYKLINNNYRLYNQTIYTRIRSSVSKPSGLSNISYSHCTTIKPASRPIVGIDLYGDGLSLKNGDVLTVDVDFLIQKEDFSNIIFAADNVMDTI